MYRRMRIIMRWSAGVSHVSSMTTQPTPSPTHAAAFRAGIRLVLWAVILGGVIMIARALPVAQAVGVVQQEVGGLGPWGPIVFGSAYIAACLLFVPGSALTLAAGAIFGLWLGTATVSIAATATAGIAFLVARYVARARVQEIAAANRTFGAIDRAIGQGGWKVIALLRLSPAVPFSLGNYLYGLTPLRFWPYLAASWIAMLPGSFLYVYLGHIGARAATAGSEPGETNPWQWVLLGAGLVATVVATAYVTRLARKALKETAVMPDGDGPPTESARGRAGRKRLWPLAAGAIVTAALAAGAEVGKERLGGLLGPPRAALVEAYENTPGGAVFDHSRFDALLRRHVAPGGWVDYDGLRAASAELDAYIASIGAAEVDELGRDERLSLLINAYNAFTLRLILDHYPIGSIKDIPSARRWAHERWNIAGRNYSLNQIEHELIRPRFAEPRIHFALVCAAVGCPPLRTESYAGSRLEEQLADQARYVHTHARWLRLHPESGEVELTALYDWYGSDFEQKASSVVAYAAQHSPELVRMINAGREPRVTFLDYDWKLNSIANRAEDP